MSGTLSSEVLFFRLLRLATTGLLIAAVFAALASAQNSCAECDLGVCNRVRCNEAPELWVINTRRAPRCSNFDQGFDCIKVARWDAKSGRYVKESMESFVAQEASMPTMFYIHGNGMQHERAMRQCWKVYEKLGCWPGKKRLVLWSWPAQRVFKTEGLRVVEMIKKNLQTKYVYAEYQGYYVAKLVERMSLSQRVMIVGHSYGGAVTASALHWLGGGSLRGLTLEGGAPVEHPNLRASIVAGAFDHDLLYPGHRLGQAFVAGEKIYISNNAQDRMLKRWSKVSLRGCQAIGSIGVNARKLGEYSHKLCQQTLDRDVRRLHIINPYLKSTRFMNTLCSLSFPSSQEGARERKAKSGNPISESMELQSEASMPGSQLSSYGLTAATMGRLSWGETK